MKATIENGELVIRIAANTVNPPMSATGKSKIIATTAGNQATAIIVDGKPVKVGLNAFISVR